MLFYRQESVYSPQMRHLVGVAMIVLAALAAPGSAEAKRCILADVIMDLGSVCVDQDSIRRDHAGMTHFDVYSPPQIHGGTATYAIDCSQNLKLASVIAKISPKGLEVGTGSTRNWPSIALSTHGSRSRGPGLVALACRTHL